MSLADDLRAAKALIDTPEKWVKGVLTEGGCFCALGAIMEGDAHDFDRAIGALAVEVPEKFCGNIPAFNDDPATTHADVMALFDRAIAAAEAKP